MSYCNILAKFSQSWLHIEEASVKEPEIQPFWMTTLMVHFLLTWLIFSWLVYFLCYYRVTYDLYIFVLLQSYLWLVYFFVLLQSYLWLVYFCVITELPMTCIFFCVITELPMTCILFVLLQSYQWCYKFSRLKGSSDDGKLKLKLHFHADKPGQVETRVSLFYCWKKLTLFSLMFLIHLVYFSFLMYFYVGLFQITPKVVSCYAINKILLTYCNDPKFSDMPGQTVQTQIRQPVWSGSTLFAILSASFGLITLWQNHIVKILEWLQQIFWVSEYLGNLRYCI